MEVQLQVFFIVALDGWGRSESRSSRLIPSKRALCIQSGQGGGGNGALVVQPVFSHYTY
jgi:hypothetical protein